MITLHIEAQDFGILVEKVRDTLTGMINGAPVGIIIDKPVARHPIDVVIEGVTEAEKAALVEPSAAPRRPGRPRSNKNSPAAAVAPQGDSAASQPAVEDNTGSAPAVSPTAEDAPTSGSVVDASVPAIGPAEVRAKLSQVNEKYGEQGLEQVSALIKEFGYLKIKDIKPEHYAAIVAKADAALAA
jgi:hypothetical protein